MQYTSIRSTTNVIGRGTLLATLLLGTTAPVLGQDQAPEQDEATINLLSPTNSHDEEILEIELHDGVVTKGRLSLPPAQDGEDANISTLVIYVHGTGPATYLTTRRLNADTQFNYFDFFADAFPERGIGFFSYNKRGVTNSDAPPWFDHVDRDAFRNVVPAVETDDLAAIIETLKQDDRLAHARVMLLGWSEGSVIAALAAEQHPDLVDAIMLAGYANENMYDVIAYQFTGEGTMLKITPVFDTDDDGAISRQEYEADDAYVARYRQAVMQDTAFDALDANTDGQLQAIDFATRSQPYYWMILNSVEHDNEEWIWNNYFRVSVPWLRQHFALEANKSRLLRMDLPIYVFHGAEDAHLPTEGVEDLKKRFQTLGKTNLEAHIFPEHDHDLNFIEWVKTGEMPDGILAIFESAQAFDTRQQP
jgi:hypothetical protein